MSTAPRAAPPLEPTAPARPRARAGPGIPIPAGAEERPLRRELYLLLFCAAFAALVFFVWIGVRAAWLDRSPSRVLVENLKDILGPFLTAYIAARLYSSMVRRYQGQLEGQRGLLAHILDTSADAIVTLDAEDRIQTWNRGAEFIFGYSDAEVLGRHASILYPPEVDAPSDLAEIRRAVEREGILRHYDCERLTRKGRRIRTEISTTILRDERGRYSGRASIVRDVTERDRLREETARRESLANVGEMAAAIAHEIKNPLAGIGGAVEVIGRSLPRDDPRTEVVAEVQRQVRRLDETVRDLLSFARPATPRFGRIDLSDFAARILRVLVEEPDLKRHAIETRIPAGFHVRADPQLLENILLNLLLNAGQALGATPGRVVLSAAADASATRVTVRDSGPGIPPEVLPNIFKPFFTTKHQGSGLGLAIVKKLAEGMGGRVVVETKPGEGAAFTVELPREAP